MMVGRTAKRTTAVNKASKVFEESPAETEEPLTNALESEARVDEDETPLSPELALPPTPPKKRRNLNSALQITPPKMRKLLPKDTEGDGDAKVEKPNSPKRKKGNQILNGDAKVADDENKPPEPKATSKASKKAGKVKPTPPSSPVALSDENALTLEADEQSSEPIKASNKGGKTQKGTKAKGNPLSSPISETADEPNAVEEKSFEPKASSKVSKNQKATKSRATPPPSPVKNFGDALPMEGAEKNEKVPEVKPKGGRGGKKAKITPPQSPLAEEPESETEAPQLEEKVPEVKLASKTGRGGKKAKITPPQSPLAEELPSEAEASEREQKVPEVKPKGGRGGKKAKMTPPPSPVAEESQPETEAPEREKKVLEVKITSKSGRGGKKDKITPPASPLAEEITSETEAPEPEEKVTEVKLPSKSGRGRKPKMTEELSSETEAPQPKEKATKSFNKSSKAAKSKAVIPSVPEPEEADDYDAIPEESEPMPSNKGSNKPKTKLAPLPEASESDAESDEELKSPEEDSEEEEVVPAKPEKRKGRPKKQEVLVSEDESSPSPKQVAKSKKEAESKVSSRKLVPGPSRVATASHPTFLVMICEAVQEIADKKGSSVPAIKNAIQAKYPELDKDRMKVLLKKNLAKGIEGGILKRPKNSESVEGAVGRFLLEKNWEDVMKASKKASIGTKIVQKTAKSPKKVKSSSKGTTEVKKTPKPVKKISGAISLKKRLSINLVKKAAAKGRKSTSLTPKAVVAKPKRGRPKKV